jgi:hypothetical protein
LQHLPSIDEGDLYTISLYVEPREGKEAPPRPDHLLDPFIERTKYEERLRWRENVVIVVAVVVFCNCGVSNEFRVSNASENQKDKRDSKQDKKKEKEKSKAEKKDEKKDLRDMEKVMKEKIVDAIDAVGGGGKSRSSSSRPHSGSKEGGPKNTILGKAKRTSSFTTSGTLGFVWF